MKKIILDHVLPIGIVVIGVLIGIFFMGKAGLFGGGQATPPTEIRTVDTPEYKKVDSLYRQAQDEKMFWHGYAKGLEESFDKLQAEKKLEPVLLKKKEQEYQAKPENEKETEFWKKYKEMWGNP